MPINSGQGLVFLAFLSGGVVAGILYETLGIVKKIPLGIVFFVISDALAVLMCAALYTVFSRIFVYGEMRFYSVISYILGFVLLKKTLQKPFMRFQDAVYNRICTLAKKLRARQRKTDTGVIKNEMADK